MATFYTEKEMARALRDLHIAPVDGKVDGSEAAKILSWRAKREYDIDYQYDPTAIRQHVKVGNIPMEARDVTNKRRNLYTYEAIFTLPISPKRGAARRKSIGANQN